MKRIYIAGALFDLRHLAGNALLAKNLRTVSDGRFQVYLPQDHEPVGLDAKSIRDSDFLGLLSCDAAVFQFDGSELDSGTVAEFMAAKFVDMPCVVVRTDFRSGGDRNSEPWNLMCSFYPRTQTLLRHSLDDYAKFLAILQDGAEASERAIEDLAKEIVLLLDRAIEMEPVPIDNVDDRSKQLLRLLGVEA